MEGSAKRAGSASSTGKRPPDGTEPGLLLALAVLAVAPALLPPAAWYLDNAPHLAELRVLAEQVLPGDRAPSGYSDALLAGIAVGQLNAPLAWLPLAGLVALGLPPLPLYLGAAALSNAAFAWGAWRLARRLFPPGPGIFVGVALALSSTVDLWGIGGAAGGMWPFRLGTGLFLAWLAAADELGVLVRALGLAALVLLHAYTAVAGMGWAALSALAALRARRWRALASWLGSVALALGLSAFYWWPLLQPELRAVPRPFSFLPHQLLAQWLLPVDVYQQLRDRWAFLGGPAGFAGLVALLGLPGLGRLRFADTALARRLGVAAGLLFLLLVLLVPALRLGWLGPDAWRHGVFFRLGWFLLAGQGLARWLDARGARLLGLGLALCAALAGWHELPLGPRARQARAELEACWAELEAVDPPGRVYHQDPFQDPDAPRELRWSHAGALLTARTGRPTLGSFYGINPYPTHHWTRSEGGGFLGTYVSSLEQAMEEVPGYPERVRGFLLAYGVGAVVAGSHLSAVLERIPGLRPLERRGYWTAWLVEEPPAGLLELPPGRGHRELLRRREEVVAEVEPGEPGTFRASLGYHPWWRAELDGESLSLGEDEDTGLLLGELPARGGRLVLRWERRDRPAQLASLLSLALLGLLGLGRHLCRAGARPEKPSGSQKISGA